MKRAEVTAERHGKCASCNRRMTVRRTFGADPALGYVEGMAMAEKAAQAWQPEVFYHNSCLEAEQLPGQTDIFDFIEGT